jgi:hypothetical protein
MPRNSARFAPSFLLKLEARSLPDARNLRCGSQPAVTLTRALVWHRAGVASKTLPGFSGTGDDGRPRHSYDHSVGHVRRGGCE